MAHRPFYAIVSLCLGLSLLSSTYATPATAPANTPTTAPVSAPGTAPGTASTTTSAPATLPPPSTRPATTAPTTLPVIPLTPGTPGAGTIYKLAPVASKQAPSLLRVSAGNVMDRRSVQQSILSGCIVDLIVTGKSLGEALGIERVTLEQATDDTGKSLIDQKSLSNPDLGADERWRHRFNRKSSQVSMQMSVKLKNPARQAHVIRLLRGRIHLAMPGKAGRDVIEIDNFTDKPGRLLGDKRLAVRQVQLCYLPPAQIEEVLKQKTPHLPIDIAPEELAAIGPLIRGMASKMNQQVAMLPILIHDPQHQIVKLSLFSNLGQPATPLTGARQIRFDAITLFWSLRGMPQKPTLQVNLKSDETAVQVPFELHDIALP